MDSQAVIYLSDRRLCEQSPVFRCYQTPVKAKYFLRFEDNTLAAQQSVEGQFDSDRIIVFLPLIGAIEINNNLIETGQIQYQFVEKGESVTVQNPYETELINYLEIHIETNQKPTNNVVMTGFDLRQKNQLHNLILSKVLNLRKDIHSLYIGKYNGRKDELLSFTEPRNVFVFIINGAFEVQNRLLESRDGLLLKNIPEIDFEALSEEAILLIMTSSF